MKNKILCSFLSIMCFCGIASGASAASYFSILQDINATANTLRNTMSTVEYSQRFQDRQQDRQDRKRTEKGYNETAEQEYYRTLQETQQLNQRYQQYNNSNDL